MRIAVVNWNRRKIGGTEQYVADIIPALHRDGHDVALLSEFDLPESREAIALPHGCPAWCVATIGHQRALNELRGWRSDLVYVHGITSLLLEEELFGLAPAVLFAHNYRGTCISGGKSFNFPVVRPCDRRFGSACLLFYFPRRCGGLSPITMWRDFRFQLRRLDLARRYRAIVTASEHMRAEYLKHGFPPERVYRNPYPVEVHLPRRIPAVPSDGRSESMEMQQRNPVRLLFVGRIETLKGGPPLLAALPMVARSLGRAVKLVVAGDGTALPDWQRRAARVEAADPRIVVAFAGWSDNARLDELAAESDLLVVPSLWPEPFGLVGPEAGLRRLPAAAFAVGGIREWLVDGVNGGLAPSDPPTAIGLADAIVRCLRDPAHHARLRDGASEIARRFGLADHVSQLSRLFAEIVCSDPAAQSRASIPP